MKKEIMFIVVLGLLSLPILSFAQQTRFTRAIPKTGQAVVTDNLTGLMWQGCISGQQGEDCTGSSAAAMNWTAALDYCQDSTWGDYIDWRLPSVIELSSIIDDQKSDPSIDVLVFPYPSPLAINYFWTATTAASLANSAWIVSFSSGVFFSETKGEEHYLRCVRSTP